MYFTKDAFGIDMDKYGNAVLCHKDAPWLIHAFLERFMGGKKLDLKDSSNLEKALEVDFSRNLEIPQSSMVIAQGIVALATLDGFIDYKFSREEKLREGKFPGLYIEDFQLGLHNPDLHTDIKKAVEDMGTDIQRAQAGNMQKAFGYKLRRSYCIVLAELNHYRTSELAGRDMFAFAREEGDIVNMAHSGVHAKQHEFHQGPVAYLADQMKQKTLELVYNKPRVE